MKKLLSAALLGLAALLTLPAQAANDSQAFNVAITLNSKCVFGAISDVAFTYTSFQGTAVTATGGAFKMKCTNTLPYTLGFTNAATPAATKAVTDATLALDYTLGLSATTGPGTGVDISYSVTGTMAKDQIGTCASASCSSLTNPQTLYVVY
jgi:hypothetical protein